MCPRGIRQSRGRESFENVFPQMMGWFQSLPEGFEKGMFFFCGFPKFCLLFFLQDSYDKLCFSTFLPLIFRSSPLQWIGFFCSRFGAREDFLPSKNGEVKIHRIWRVPWYQKQSSKIIYSPWNWQFRTWKWMVGRRSFPFGARPMFRGELLVLGRVHDPQKGPAKAWRIH